jgi:hypothetical protein
MGRRRFVGLCIRVRLSFAFRGKAFEAEICLPTSFGLLHRIPPASERQPGTTPVELQEDLDDYEEQELFVPADITDHTNEPENRYHESIHRAHTPRHDEVRRPVPVSPRSQRNSHDTDRTLPNHDDKHRHHFHHLDERLLSQESSAAQKTPRGTFTANSVSTPTRSHPFGTRLNGDSSPPS